MKKYSILIFGLILFMTSCEALNDLASGLSDSEITEGLKTALNVGTDTASGDLSKENGYYNNPLVKIPLPTEAETLRNLINNNTVLATASSIVGLDGAFEQVIKSVNRAAEDAASDAAPIFKDAITNLTITQGLNILNGIVPESSAAKSASFDSTAATEFLKIQTYNSLVALYAPKINTSLNADLIGSLSAVEAWSSMTTKYNTFLAYPGVSLAATLAGLSLPASITTDLGEFSTQQALNGLFLKVGKEEKNIRKNPLEWASTAVGNILEKVFGSVQE